MKKTILILSLMGCKDLSSIFSINNSNIENGKTKRGLNLEIIEACNKGDANLVEKALISGADPNAEDVLSGKTPLMIASEKNYSDIVIFLTDISFNKKADINFKNQGYEHEGETALILAVRNKHARIVHELLRRGANVNELNENGETPIITALKAKDHATAKVLLKKDLDLDVVDKDDKDALSVAIDKGDLESARTIYFKKYNCNERDARKKTLILLSLDILNDDNSYLLENSLKGYKDSINEQDVDGDTALIVSVKKRNKKAVELLLANRADKSKKNKKGYTALAIASNKDYDNAEILNLLRLDNSSIEDSPENGA